eukprot:7105909-Ditylum_brightwellii.AAC.1
MARTAPTVEDILKDFLQPTIPRVNGEPSYETIHVVHKILQENAASVHNDKGGGVHGHLALVLTPGHYQQVTGHIFAPPVHPGPAPPNPQMFLLAQDLQAQRDNYFMALYSHKLYHNTDKALVKQIMTVFDECFYKALCNAMVGYKNCTVVDFLHLHGNYGQIMSTMITDLEAKMSALFNPAAPIKDLFVQISDGQDLTVAAGMPYSDIQLVTKAYDLIYKT